MIMARPIPALRNGASASTPNGADYIDLTLDESEQDQAADMQQVLTVMDRHTMPSLSSNGHVDPQIGIKRPRSDSPATFNKSASVAPFNGTKKQKRLGAAEVLAGLDDDSDDDHPGVATIAVAGSGNVDESNTYPNKEQRQTRVPNQESQRSLFQFNPTSGPSPRTVISAPSSSKPEIVPSVTAQFPSQDLVTQTVPPAGRRKTGGFIAWEAPKMSQFPSLTLSSTPSAVISSPVLRSSTPTPSVQNSQTKTPVLGSQAQRPMERARLKFVKPEFSPFPTLSTIPQITTTTSTSSSIDRSADASPFDKTIQAVTPISSFTVDASTSTPSKPIVTELNSSPSRIGLLEPPMPSAAYFPPPLPLKDSTDTVGIRVEKTAPDDTAQKTCPACARWHKKCDGTVPHCVLASQIRRKSVTSGPSIISQLMSPKRPAPQPAKLISTASGDLQTVMKAFKFRQPCEGNSMLPNATSANSTSQRRVRDASQRQISTTVIAAQPHTLVLPAGHVVSVSRNTPPPTVLQPPQAGTLTDNFSSTTPRFEKSRMMQKEKGARWTLEDKVLLVYLKEEYNHLYQAGNHDDRFGRNFGGSSSTTSIKYIQELRQPGQHRAQLQLYRTLPALRAIMTLDLPITEVAAALRVFIDTNTLPNNLEIQAFMEQPKLNSRTNVASSPIVASFGSTPPVTENESYESYTFAPKRILRRDDNTVGNKAVVQHQSRANSIDLDSSASEAATSDPVSRYYTGERRFVRRTRSCMTRPYLTHKERNHGPEAVRKLTYPTNDHGASLATQFAGIIHVPMTNLEYETLLHFFMAESGYSTPSSEEGRTSLKSLVYQMGIGHNRLYQMARKASGTVLHNRTTHSIVSYITDIMNNDTGNSTALQTKIRPQAPPRSTAQKLNSELRRRAAESVNTGVKAAVLATMGPSKAYTFMSGDVGTIKFAANSNVFIAGSVCDKTSNYNFPGNLVLGDSYSNVLQDIDYHWERPGANSTESEGVDNRAFGAERTFYTVSMTDFSADGRYFFSAGYDGLVRAFTTNNGSGVIDQVQTDTTVSLTSQAPIGAPVDLLQTSKIHGRIAVGAQLTKNSISIYECSDQGQLNYLSSLCLATEYQYHPSCLQWGTSFQSNLLLTGFMNAGEGSKDGEFALWDLQAQRYMFRKYRGAVFDLNWSPHGNLFAAAMRPSSKVNPLAKSIVRVYDCRIDYNPDCRSPINDYDCPAKDINDVVFSQHDDHILAAGTTDGALYIYDLRRHDQIVHTLHHSAPIDASMGKDDTGVRFCAWNEGRHGLITGSSDGYVKSWDVYRSPQDTHVEDLAVFSSGVYSGAFSPDYTRLAIGEVKKTFTIFEPFNKNRELNDLDGFKILKNSSFKSAKPIEAPAVAPTQRGCQLINCLETERLEDRDSLEDCRRWEGRIPAELVKDVNLTTKKPKAKFFQAVRKCASCGGAARPSATLEKPLCEACSFACFRCGERRRLAEDLQRVHCSCGEWEIGALGYEFVVPRIDKPRINRVVSHFRQSSDDADSDDEDDDDDEPRLSGLYQSEWSLKAWNHLDSCYRHVDCNKALRPVIESEVETGKDYCDCGSIREKSMI